MRKIEYEEWEKLSMREIEIIVVNWFNNRSSLIYINSYEYFFEKKKIQFKKIFFLISIVYACSFYEYLRYLCSMYLFYIWKKLFKYVNCIKKNTFNLSDSKFYKSGFCLYEYW